ncbi:hypothetical protein [Nonomuraea salmonea]|uniref:hypothetical protein n=1 Tax=Nonomuraea salmonea TaxID=46181 RepID=UPI002FEADDF2
MVFDGLLSNVVQVAVFGVGLLAQAGTWMALVFHVCAGWHVNRRTWLGTCAIHLAMTALAATTL